MTDKEKIKVTKKQFAEVLYNWFSENMTEQAIKEMGKALGFNIKNNEEFHKIFIELFVLNMWLIVYTICSAKDKVNECLDIFHHIVYERPAGVTEEGFSEWMTWLAANYVDYNRAMETDHPSTPLWVVASLFNGNLFGEIKKDPIMQMKILTHIGLYIVHLGEAIAQYDIE